MYKFRNTIIHAGRSKKSLSTKEFNEIIGILHRLVITLANIYNPERYNPQPKRNPRRIKDEIGWSEVLGRLDFFRFDTPKNWKEMIEFVD